MTDLDAQFPRIFKVDQRLAFVLFRGSGGEDPHAGSGLP